ncbi:hypothetical protein COK37_20880 [Bacillus thuringiensis]|uniref:hypothetical protein n=1 Tax=Bacillus thuringiensis TaxID=1428 RepID=UPI000BF8847B|nr:hypothetical protein [Bacillus thuringiensis]PEV50774.1 hypothetical protein CN432_09225 [Bacillus thuringiensis]PFR65810.1 hypothetical protein COK37_20880 [Bacillus thuringiensis]PFT77409.1 hypothetical protein COK70_19655 [Bacillus thuringiensis]PFV87946.1 hypothetical protein COL06_15270 [Bacillus thuringiensis]
MKSIKFISNISISIPSDQEVSKIILHDKINQPLHPEKQKRLYPLFALNREYRINKDSSIGIDLDLLSKKIPASFEKTSSDLGVDSLKKLLEITPINKPTYLAYCQETNEPSIYLTPALKLKKLLKLKGTIPFSIGYQGSAAFTGALSLLENLYHNTDSNNYSIITTTDQVYMPQTRFFPGTYPKGDCSTSSIFSHDTGKYKILKYSKLSFPIRGNPLEWTHLDYMNFETQLLSYTYNLLTDWILKQNIQWVIIQNLSEHFVNNLENFLENKQCTLFKRLIARESNLLTSDCLVSLKDAETKQAFKINDNILLLQAGPLSHIGLVLLKKEKDDDFVYLK